MPAVVLKSNRELVEPHHPACDPAALLDLTQRLLQAESTAAMCRLLADGIQELTACESAVVAVVRGSGCRVEAVSHTESIDPNAERIRNFQATCAAAIAESPAASKSVPATEEVLRFRSADGRTVAAAMLLGRVQHETFEARYSSETSIDLLGPVLDTKLTALRRQRGRMLFDDLARKLRTNRRIATAVSLVIAILACLPLPYQVRCDCELQPVVRRHVAAPFDGVFQRSLCKPGDVVAAGQVLGLLDAKELAWELAGVTAERERAAKSRDVNHAAGKTAAGQIDRLEAQRLDERRKLLEHRLQNLEVKSPLAGVVVAGDLEKSEGAPVKLGQSLYEVAPLDLMIVEALVPEADIDRVRVGQTVCVNLDAQPVASLSGTIARVYPRAEVRRDANVFIAEVICENADGCLRPGMKGRAAVRTDYCLLFWIATHRFFETAYRWLW